MWVTVPTTKTLKKGQGVILPIRMNPSNPYCPVEAYKWATGVAPAAPNAPIFINPDTNRTLTAQQCNSLLQVAAIALRHPRGNRVTLHSLRRSGARLCAFHGVSESDIKCHGTWHSTSVHTYVPKEVFTGVPGVIAKLLTD